MTLRGTIVAQWLRCCATNRKVAGSIPDGVIGIFHWLKPSGRTMALGLTQPVIEMSTTNISCVVKAAGVWGWQPYPFMCRLSLNLGASTSWQTQGLFRAVMGLPYLYIYIYKGTRAISTTWRRELPSNFSPCKARRWRKFTPFWQKH